MTVMTIYFCGTSSSKYDNVHSNYWQGELISTLAENQEGKEFAEWNIVDGPGSGNLQSDQLWVESKLYPDMIGQLFGSGWQENIQHVLQILKGVPKWKREKLTEEQYNKLKDAGIPLEKTKVGSFLWRRYDYGDRKVTPQDLQRRIIEIYRNKYGGVTQVNLVGWSRGGISCHMLANAMLNDDALKTIPVNIFTIDPVPGLGNFQTEKIMLGKNVKEYVAFYARDERSKGFACEIPKTDKVTRVHLFPMPGRHATLVGNGFVDGVDGNNGEGNSKKDRLKEPGCLVRHFAEVCLTRWGVKFTEGKTLALTADQILACHQIMEEDSKLYQDMHDMSYTKVTENSQGERSVSYFNEWAAFSTIQSDSFTPAQGLAANYLQDRSIYNILKE
ncbi:hypothetical protein Ppb6_02791 [Photorhabdus australis subsp. thailandensis]|uniref:Uncharacterized protein n=1 Tax=Photorhabdus australis subsp. thailandensis TaxID=2805096 RepID=A0A1C0U229_9GAMM|nr:hypothetical protein [Photorhabdus australis]OCQ51997.1 hypothetical protein Ppb6_02791 [Photorhabdus australis subsp. thailandensis]